MGQSQNNPENGRNELFRHGHKLCSYPTPTPTNLLKTNHKNNSTPCCASLHSVTNFARNLPVQLLPVPRLCRHLATPPICQLYRRSVNFTNPPALPELDLCFTKGNDQKSALTIYIYTDASCKTSSNLYN
jgi:hypothetical protein